MCAGRAGQRGLSVALLDHSKKIGEKIRISGGGRCNFTNLHSGPANFLSQNPHFCKSALARFTPHDFLALMEKYNIKWHEKSVHPNAKGQLFCDDSAQDIIDMLLAECKAGGVNVQTETLVSRVGKTEAAFKVETAQGVLTGSKLVIATGGLSIPKIGASDFGYKIARQFGLKIVETSPALVPLTFGGMVLEGMKALSGLSVDAEVSAGGVRFREGMLFTHRGLSGPSILQISSYFHEGNPITVNLVPDKDMIVELKQLRQKSPRIQGQTALSNFIPARLASWLLESLPGLPPTMADYSDSKIDDVAALVNSWQVRPAGTEGYRTAEVTKGGVDTDEISSKTFESKNMPGLYFIGEVLDVTGHLGGHNFQWAWASAVAAAEAL
ncbi:MAG: NAD(P)/FAD-dependent oxidoreductase [Alphaproteobacteria bacterium]|nr:NAD(P)/FAD-dependent oxidoreductase [Alphaproteobacteria bacterium]